MSKAKHLLLAERISHERELREAEKTAFDHEREMRAVWDKHERELRTQDEMAVDKARAAHDEVVNIRLESLNHFAERMERQSQTFLPVDRWEREHAALSEKSETALGVLRDRVETESKVTVRQDSTQLTTDNFAANRRWLYGIMVALFSTFFLVSLHILNIVK